MPRRSKHEAGESFAARALREMTVAPLDAETARRAIRDTLKALVKQARALLESDLSEVVRCPECRKVVRVPMSAGEIARALSNSSKAIDDMARLVEFVEGRADSRPDVSGGVQSFMKLLTPEQFEVLGKWIAEGEARGDEGTVH